MSRKSILFGIGTVLLLAGVGTCLILLLLHEPRFYRDTAIPEGKQRKQLSKQFVTEFVQLCNNVLNGDPWEVQFTEERVNSYFEEDFVSMSEKVLPEGISDPRVSIEPDKIRLAFRYGTGPWRTVISIDLRVWLVTAQPNVIALELQGLHAGSLPIAAQTLLERVSETARQENIDVTWYRHNGNPVALLRFQADQPRPSVKLEGLELHQGEIKIRGRGLESAAVQGMLPMASVRQVSAN